MPAALCESSPLNCQVKSRWAIPQKPSPCCSSARTSSLCREGFRASRASPSAGNAPRITPVEAVISQCYAKTVARNFLVVVIISPYKRGRRGYAVLLRLNTGELYIILTFSALSSNQILWRTDSWWIILVESSPPFFTINLHF